jgi:hypothetical protein
MPPAPVLGKSAPAWRVALSRRSTYARRVWPQNWVWRWLAVCALLLHACARDTPPAFVAMPNAVGRVHVSVVDPETGAPMACKLLLSATPVELTPNYGSSSMIGEWLAPHALGSGNAVYGDPCDFELELPAVQVHIQASQGIERELAQSDLSVKPGLQEVRLELPRALNTHGYACADFHVHSAPSFDSDVPLDQRLISAVAEGLDAIAPTDHEALGDWDAEMARMNMADELTLVLGDEVTPDQWPTPQTIGHFGVYPVPRDFDPHDHELTWQTPAGLLERLDTLYPDSVIQMNHPRWGGIGLLSVAGFNPLDPKLDQRLGLSHVDAIELWNSHEVDATGGTPIETTLQDFYALLDFGIALVGTGNTDTHELSRHPLGYPRNCIQVLNDGHPGLTPEAITDGVGLGRVTVTSGPWLEVSFAGHGPGQLAMRPAAPVLDVLVDAASWVPVDRIHVVVNGHTVATREIHALPSQLHVPLELSSALSYIMVLAEGDAPLPSVAGVLHAPQRSFAFSNPIWVQAP